MFWIQRTPVNVGKSSNSDLKCPDRKKQTLLRENSFKREFTGAPVCQILRADSTDETSRGFCWLPITYTQPLALAVSRRRTRAGAWTRAGSGGGGSLGRRWGGRGRWFAHLGGALGGLLRFGGWGGCAAGRRAAAGAGTVVGFGRAAGASWGAWCRATTGTGPRTGGALRPGATSRPERGKKNFLHQLHINIHRKNVLLAFIKWAFSVSWKKKINLLITDNS